MWFEAMHPEWQNLLADQRARLDKLESQVGNMPNLAPRNDLVMSAFTAAPDQARVVILGQDPYPAAGVAIGHSFAVNPETAMPASLKNIATELKADVGADLGSVDLHGWRTQGILLLNRALTTIESAPASHSKSEWKVFTRAAIAALISSGRPVILVLWGSHAQKIDSELATELLDSSTTVRIIKGVHPSPLSAYRGFFGSRPFSAINSALRELGSEPIDWNSNAS